mmetsp:Transcript_5830/g.13781  ORF Transcript_5830/g.13781 Transcript_5830/m.13781 type:complete len:288 (+) Transcript_5830:41-904(+)
MGACLSDRCPPHINPETKMYLDKYNSNPEARDPVPAVKWQTIEDLGEITFIGEAAHAVGNAKIHLDYHNVKYAMSATLPQVAGTPYPLVPVLRADGRQLNGNYIINKHLIPLLYGPGEIDLEWESRISYQLNPSLYMAAVANGELWQCLQATVNLPKALYHVLPLSQYVKSCYGPGGALHKAVGDRYRCYEDLHDFGREFRQELGFDPFFHGERPGSTDLSMYGAVALFCYTNCAKIKRRLIADSQLQEWWDRMSELVPAAIFLTSESIYRGFGRRSPAPDWRPWLQ